MLFIRSRRKRRKTDPFALFLKMVTVGMGVTLIYQVMLYHGPHGLSLAAQLVTSLQIGRP